MGWFDEFIKERKQKNQAVFEESFNSLSKGVFKGVKNTPYHSALTHLFHYYRIKNAYIPYEMKDPITELDFLLSKQNLRTKKIVLEGFWQRENTEPILAFTSDNKTPVALFPGGTSSYYYFDPKTGKKRLVTHYIQDILDPEAITFYRPLSLDSLKFQDYFHFIRQSIRPIDLIFVVILTIGITALSMITPHLSRILMGEVIDNVDHILFLTIALFMSGAGISLLLIRAAQAVVSSRVTLKAENALHSATMERLLSLPPSFFAKYNTGELNASLNSVCTLSYMIINGVFIGGLSSLLGIGYVFQIATFSGYLALISFGVVLCNVAFMVFVAVLGGRQMSRQTKLNAREKGVTYSLINGIQKIRLSGSEKRAFAKWAACYTETARVQYNPPFIIKFSPAFSLLISVLGNILIYLTVVRSGLDSATYVAFNSSYSMLSGTLAALTFIVSNIISIKPLMEMVKPILLEKPESTDDKEVVEDLEGNIRLDNVSFRYDEASPLVLNGLSLSIKKGEYVAIVGKTGCGKSTLVRLLLGFEKPNEGSIYYDDMDINTIELSSLRKKIGSVTQNGSLFHADIKYNITISAPELGEEEAWEAARIANIDRDIKAMPMGMHTIISEGQGGISGGQKQRIMIARAIVHKPKVLIFDEATSALDNRSQKAVTEAIGQLNCTRIVIAHRLSTIKECDRIVYLENGKIAEEGTYDELIQLKGRFNALIEKQIVDE